MLATGIKVGSNRAYAAQAQNEKQQQQHCCGEGPKFVLKVNEREVDKSC